MSGFFTDHLPVNANTSLRRSFIRESAKHINNTNSTRYISETEFANLRGDQSGTILALTLSYDENKLRLLVRRPTYAWTTLNALDLSNDAPGRDGSLGVERPSQHGQRWDRRFWCRFNLDYLRGLG